MAVVTPENNPIVSDTVVFSLPTPDANGCYVANPYKVDSVVIYFVERDFASPNERQYESKIFIDSKVAAADAAESVACDNPTEENIREAERLRNEANATATSSTFYYHEAKPVKVVGNHEYPAWLSTDTENAFIENVDTARFQYSWDTHGMREGDYFMCWTWTPNPAGDSLSQHIKLSLGGNTVLTTSIPTHYTQPDKYETLLERYLPEMFKMQMTSTDRSPDILEKFNGAVAKGFTTVEDLANQIVDLQDANSTHELFLPLLAKYFGLKLKTNDPTLWRRQIKQAIPLFKKKGTRKGLEEALAQAGISMSKLTRLWQVISSYTWQESFVYDGQNESWELAKVALDLDPTNFGLWVRYVGEDDYTSLSSDYVSFSTSEGVTTMTWAGSGLLVDPIDLEEGDIVRVLYLYNTVPDGSAQTLENYLRALPLADQRDERDQDYPLKNWNVRVLEEDDTLFSLLVPNRHPYIDPLVFGKVRTEFPYSENAYNNDEYNGSIRNSKQPCDIDKDFVDPCTACLSSKFNIDLEIESLSNDRILEAQDVIREFAPFHAVLQTMNFTGGVNEFVMPPVEDIEVLVNVRGGDFVICGEGQMWFNRAMKKGTTTQVIDRTMLADSEQVITADSATAYNDFITVFCGEVNFDRIGMSLDGTALMEILAPSPNAGEYNLSDPYRHTAVVDGATEPLNTAAFTFRLSNVLTDGSLCNITQDGDRGIVQVLDSGLLDIQNFIRGKCYLVTGGDQYEINGFVPDTDDQFYILGYSGGDTAGTTLTIYQRLVDNEIGYLSYRGLKLQTVANLETTLQIQNGSNPVATPLENDNFMENFIITINDQDYFISGIDGTTVTLSGTGDYWKTLGAGGTLVSYDVTHYTKKEDITIPGQQFDLPSHTFRTYDRQGREVITSTTENDPPPPPAPMMGSGASFTEYVSQTEGISFEIEWADGSKEQGEI